jgi:tetratricopeptide (TPR) repeat protein
MGRAYYGSISKQENEASRKHFRRAIELDPEYAQAYAALALTYLDDWRRDWSENPEEAIDKALTFARQAIAVDEMLPQAHFALGFISLYAKGQHDLAIEKAKAALALDPNYVSGYALLSSAYFFSGLPEKSLPLDRKAIQLDPSSSFLYHMHLGRSYYFQGRYKEALDSLKQAAERNYNYIPNHVWLAAT